MANPPPLQAAIPGQSMTDPVGGRPWQTPPQYATVKDALDFYIPRMTSDGLYEGLLDNMELGIPLTIMADSMQSAGVLQGKHTLDVGILIMPVLIEMLAYLGDEAGVKYTMGTEKPIDDDKISSTRVALAMKSMRSKLPKALEEKEDGIIPEEPEMMSEEPEMIEDKPQPSGLMARKV
tara:strand:- start:1688 stop:2221 length:534 start_codon:yes stop_codon:yes gene_type:complete